MIADLKTVSYQSLNTSNPTMSFTTRYIKPYYVRVIGYGLFVIFSVVFTMVTALSVADFLKILFEPAGSSADTLKIASSGNLISQALNELYVWLIGFGTSKALFYFSFLVFVLYGLKNVFTYLAAVEISVIRTRVVRDIRNSLFTHAMHLPLSYYGSHRKGDILSRFSNDIVEYDENILGSIQLLFASLIAIVLYLAMLFYINLKLTLMVLCMLPIVVFVVSGISRKLRRKSKTLQEKNSVLMSLIEETMAGLKVIKAYTAIDFSNNRFQSYNAEYTRLRTRMYWRMYLASPVSDFMGNTIVIAILLFGSWLVFNHDSGLTPELFISYLMMFVLMIPPAKDLTTAVSQMKKGRACADRLQEFLDVDTSLSPNIATPQPSTSQTPRPFNGLHTAIEFCNVAFHYNETTEVLHNLNFTLPKGKTVALVGSSGSGKSTLADLLACFYLPTQGTILIDGIPLNQLNLSDYRRHIGIVAQDTILFNDTILNNIAFGCTGLKGAANTTLRQQVEEAARIANAHDFIMQMPEGYDTNIGDGGDRLSGGQRQRISIARAILLNPDILIMDEATSALDTEAEHQVQLALNNVMQGRTTLVIAHRLSTIVGADEILVLEQGVVVQRGTHQQLLQEDGRYKQLIEMQEINKANQ